ncbi:MAG: hypothetical protein JWN52_8096 [Actinomycetia bacterium]|nr:hypothetical protein [Actinomycetes bacterium]
MGEVIIRAEELTRLARDIKKASNAPELRKRLSKELRVAAKPLVPALRASIAQIPSKGRPARKGRAPLRRLLDRSVSVQVKTGKWATVRVFMNPKKMPDGTKSLPGYFEGITGKGVLRHPVFGNRDVWASQLPRPYFARGVSGAEQDARAAIERVMEDIAKEIE